MAEWLVEPGIGETRAILVDGGDIVEAHVELEDTLRAGTIAEAQLVEIIVPRTTGRVRFADGAEALLDGIPQGLTQGAKLLAMVRREVIPEPGRAKVARVVPAPDGAALAAGPDLIARIGETGLPVRRCHPHEADAFEAAGWSELIEEAESGEIAFDGGALRMAITPAMTLFDVDGPPPLDTLAVRAARAVARAIRRHGIGGSIGVDFPTLAGKAQRLAVAEVIDAELPQPFERTAMNGFGFLQIVRRRTRASLPELLRADPVGAATRAELRRMERLQPPLPGTHMVSEPVARRLAERPDWMAALAARAGAAPRIVTPGAA